ncbi:MAG: hypothetical protein AAGD18_18385 [Actinomycetota bacterium]
MRPIARTTVALVTSFDNVDSNHFAALIDLATGQTVRELDYDAVLDVIELGTPERPLLLIDERRRGASAELVEVHTGELLDRWTGVTAVVRSPDRQSAVLHGASFGGGYVAIDADGSSTVGPGCAGFLADGRRYQGCDGFIEFVDPRGDVERVEAVPGLWWPIGVDLWMRADIDRIDLVDWGRLPGRATVHVAASPTQAGVEVDYVVDPLFTCLDCAWRLGFASSSSEQVIIDAAGTTVLRTDRYSFGPTTSPSRWAWPQVRQLFEGVFRVIEGGTTEPIRGLDLARGDFIEIDVDIPAECDRGFFESIRLEAPVEDALLMLCDPVLATVRADGGTTSIDLAEDDRLTWLADRRTRLILNDESSFLVGSREGTLTDLGVPDVVALVGAP